MRGPSEATNDGLRVECYAGYRGEETPRRFYLGMRCIEVVAVVERWLAPDYRYFKLEGADGHRYILREAKVSHRWELTSLPADI